MTFGQRLRAFRKDKGLSMQECADRAGILQSQWCRLENAGYDNPEYKTVQKIAQGLDESVEVVSSWTRFVSTLQEPDAEIARRLHPILQQLPPKKRREVLDTIEEMTRILAKTAA